MSRPRMNRAPYRTWLPEVAAVMVGVMVVVALYAVLP